MNFVLIFLTCNARVRLVQRMELQRNDAENGIAEKENWPGEWELTLLFGKTEISVENCNTIISLVWLHRDINRELYQPCYLHPYLFI